MPLASSARLVCICLNISKNLVYRNLTLMFLNNWFDDGTGSMFMPDEIYEDQYDPKGLNKKKGI